MGSEDDRPLYDDEEEDFEDDDVVSESETSSSNFNLVTVSSDNHLPTNSSNLVTVALAADPTRYATVADKKPVVVAERGLFQRLWTDEDEIEILKGFLEHIKRRGGAHDAAVFYEEIKGKLRIEFNKSQLVEKLRRLKKKYRTASGHRNEFNESQLVEKLRRLKKKYRTASGILYYGVSQSRTGQLVEELLRLKKNYRTASGKINSGKEVTFKSPHDQATFEISKKIWFEQPVTRLVEDEELKPNHNIISFHHNGGVDLNLKGSATPKKRARPVKSEEIPQFSPPISQVAATPVANSIPGVIEETVRSCLTPVLKELVQSATNSSSRGFGAIGGFSPMGFSFGSPSPLGCLGGVDMGNSMMDERWRKQQILELDVYSKRLALVQDQIKSTMDELRSKGS